MKKFTLIEADKYISVDGVGIFFTEENWPFADIEHLWAIQWKDDGTEDGTGEVEYDSPVPNTPATRELITRYVNHFNDEKQSQEDAKRKEEEENLKQSLSWQEAMAELEGQMEEMQQRHDKSLRNIVDDHDSQLKKMTSSHDDQLHKMGSLQEKIAYDASEEIHKTHERIQEAHENFFYGEERIQNNVSESETKFQFEAGYENLTVFDGNVDQSLFDDSVDDSYFNVEEADIVTPEDIKTEDLIDASTDAEEQEEDDTPTLSEFEDIDLNVLDSEFSLELLFEEDSSEQVVSEIEKLISEDESEVPDAEIPDNSDDEPTTD